MRRLVFLGLVLLTTSCAVDPKYAYLQDMAQEAQRRDRQRNQPPPAPPLLPYRPGNRISDGEVVPDNLPKASAEVRRFANLVNLPVESERERILVLARMQPIQTEWMVKPLDALTSESVQLTQKRAQFLRTADAIEQLQSTRSQAQALVTAARRGDADAKTKVTAMLAGLGSDEYVRAALAHAERWTSLLRELAAKQNITDSSVYVFPVLMSTNLPVAGSKLAAAKAAMEARFAAVGNLVSLFAIALALDGRPPPSCGIVSVPAGDRTPAGHDSMTGAPYVLVEQCTPSE